MFCLIATAATSSLIFKAGSLEQGFNNVAFFLYHDEQQDAAKEMFKQSLEENPEYEIARYNLATVYFEQGSFDQAIKELEILYAQDPNNPHYAYDLAVNLVENMRQHNKGYEHIDRAITLYQEADALEPGFGYAQENIVVLERLKAAEI